MKLTLKSIAAFKHKGGWDVRWDDAVPGFGVRVYPSGKKSYVISYRSGGLKRLMVLGPVGIFETVEDARNLARERLVAARKGADPLEQKRREAQGETFADLIDAYIKDHAKPHKKSWKDDERRLRQHIPAFWRRRKIERIAHLDVLNLHAKIGADYPYEANRLLSLLHLMFRLAVRWGYVERGFPNPASEITRFKETQRQRWVHPSEFPILAEAIDQEPNVYVRSGLWLLLLTGLRKQELLGARRDDIDWERAQLRLPITKSGEEQRIALSTPAIAILQATPELPNNPYILPGQKEGEHLVNIDKPWRRTRKAAGLDDVTLHDLRRSVGSWMSEAGIDLNTIKSALRHRNISTTLIYSRLSADPARAAMEQHGQRVMEIAGRQRLVEVAGEKT
jgi:integrase